MSEELLTGPLFKTGDQVCIHNSNPPGHRRTPNYIKGKTGVIERYCGAFVNPEESAYGFEGLPKKHLYRVRFDQNHIWKFYDGKPGDTLDLEIYEHWLRPADGAAPKLKKAVIQ
ncbi:MAG: SH3-like domain-containing protein [Pseudomonadota bacterium]|nr:SH3-like domain-containing protein [Pseudomonadota bacterium]